MSKYRHGDAVDPHGYGTMTEDDRRRTAVPQEEPRANRSSRGLMSSAAADIDLPIEALRVLATAPKWWARRACAVGLSGRATDALESVAAPLPEDIDIEDVPIREDLLDASPEQLADAYVTGLAPTVRAKHGRHYTPALLAQELWANVLKTAGGYPDGLVLDPAAGAGCLLLPPLRTWLAGQRTTDPQLALAAVTSAVAGRDLDSAAVWLGNLILSAELLPLWVAVPASRRRKLPALLTVRDGLDTQGPPAAAIVMNPPYGRVTLTDVDRQRWAHALTGHANIYALFLAAAVEQVVAGGVVTALIPAGWLGGSYFKGLRTILANQAPPRRVTFVTERGGVFSTGALQETVLATFVVGGRRTGVHQNRLTVNGHAERKYIGPGALPAQSAEPWLLPRERADVALLRIAAKMPHRLADYGWSVSTGPLVWNRHKDEIRQKPCKTAVAILWAADIDGGKLHRDIRRDSQRYMVPATPRTRSSHVRTEPAYVLQRTTAPEQARRLVGASLDQATLDDWGGEIVIENHVNVLSCPDSSSVLTLRIVDALFASAAVDRLYRCMTGSVAVSAYELSALPLPDAEVIESWSALGDADLAVAVDAAYGV
ncbi:MAG: hypothetical protein QM809_18330 [Gordonia sp. (in: high G+C Gram-positive bacteria)]|uniref:Eco57I restriction-modification methylase domain-containing protein n=1 Tax=Gordonia sp. (in: high G+C Gram-positive bacteria) TaxID=84139 RepID=UPI0039E327C5